MKRLFGTPKRAILSAICIVIAVAGIGAITVKSVLITKAEAKTVALRDAGLSEGEVSALRARLTFDDGRFQYDVDFYSDGIEYEYSIQAKDGDIIARDIEGGGDNRYGQDVAADAGNANPSAPEENDFSQPQEGAGNQPARDGDSAARPQGISADEAKAAALRDAGLSEEDVTFKKIKLDSKKSMEVYEVEFYTSDTEYDYDISASDGTIIEKSVEVFQLQAGRADSDANSPGDNYIGVDSAKEIAINHANLKAMDVAFTKAKLENDDGRAEYEIEFRQGRTEYEYTIDAVSGNIIEYDVDYD